MDGTEEPTTQMSDSELKTCPFCKERIRAEAVKCRFCGEWLTEGGQIEVAGERRRPSEPDEQLTDKSVVVEGTATEPADSVSANTPPIAESPRIGYARGTIAVIPLILIVLVVWQAGVTGIQNKVSGIEDIAAAALSYCTTPFSLVALLVSAVWFWSGLRRALPHRNIAFVTRVCVIVVALLVCLSVIAVSVGLALTRQRQTTSPTAFNPRALDGWELTKRDQQSRDEGLSVAGKKGMREQLALVLKGTLASDHGIDVSLEGADHDKLVVKFGGTRPSVDKLAQALQLPEPDFWNQIRFRNFSEVVLSGANRSESIPASKFMQWTRDYDAFVSNMRTMYGNHILDDRAAEVNPAIARTLRQRLAPMLNGGLKRIYNPIEVHLEGASDDKLVIHMPQMDARSADNLLNSFRNDKDTNLLNSLQALGFTDLILSGDSYRRDVPRNEFVGWCRNYESYLAKMHTELGRISADLEHESTQHDQ